MAAKSDLPGRRFSVADLAKKALPSVDYKLTKNYCYCNDGEAIKRLPGYDSLCKGQLHYPPTDKNRNCENENAYYREYYQIPFSYFRELVQELIDNGAQDLIAQPILADIINAPDKVAGKYEFISNHNNRNQYGVDISDSKLAWLIARNLNIACMADNIVKPLGFPVTEEKCENYIPYPTNKLFLKHWAIQLADDDKSIIYYDSDSKVHGLPDDSDDQAKQSDSSMPYAMVMKGKYHLGFDNRAMLLALEVTASKWDIRKNKEAIKYQWLKHNCQDFIIEVIKEYLQDSLYQGGNSYHKIYLKKITSAKQAIE